MNKFAPCLLIILLSATANALSLDQLAAYLTGMPQFCCAARYEVLTPMFEQPILYDIRLESHENHRDTLAQIDYVIDWTLHAPLGDTHGFDSYFDGNYFRLRNNRLQEYHFERDSLTFKPNGNVAKGIQRCAQFAELLPQFLGQDLLTIAADTTYSHRILTNSNSISVIGSHSIDGYECKEFCYTFDLSSLKPLKVTLENNPGQPGEQSISIEYKYDTACHFDSGLSIGTLSSVYPEEFALYRQSAYSLENMPGKRLPTFYAKSLDGTRCTFNAKADSPSVIAFLDSDVATTAEVISSIRRACGTLPFRVCVLWAFVSANSYEIESLLGKILPDEDILISARSAAKDCGAVNTPAILFCNKAGIVCDYIYGFNNNLFSDVIKKAYVTHKY